MTLGSPVVLAGVVSLRRSAQQHRESLEPSLVSRESGGSSRVSTRDSHDDGPEDSRQRRDPDSAEKEGEGGASAGDEIVDIDGGRSGFSDAVVRIVNDYMPDTYGGIRRLVHLRDVLVHEPSEGRRQGLPGEIACVVSILQHVDVHARSR